MAKIFAPGPAAPPAVPPPAPLPEALKGKSAEEMYAMLKDEHTTIMDGVKAKKYDELTTPPVQPVTPPAKPPARQAPPPPHKPLADSTVQTSYQQPQPPEQIDPVMDPGGFMQQQLDQRIGGLVQTTVGALRNTNREVFKQSRSDYDKYSEEIEQFVDALHPQLQANPEAYRRGYDFVRSTHIDEIIAEGTKAGTAGALATALADAGLDEGQIAGIVAKTNGNVQPAGEVPAPSLFQPNVGVPPRVASSTTTPAPNVPAPRTGGKFSKQEHQMMERFEMTPEEWAAEREQNTDLASSLREE